MNNFVERRRQTGDRRRPQFKLDDKNESEEVIDLFQYWLVVNKFKWRILGFALSVTVLVVLLVLAMTPKYSATATLLIEANQVNAVSIEEVYGLDSSKTEYFLTQFEILKSKSIAEKVIEELELMDNEEFAGNPDEFSLKSWFKSLLPIQQETSDASAKLHAKRLAVLGAFLKRLTISPIRKTQLVKISFESESPELAAKIVNTLGETYIESHLEAKIGITRKAADWLNTRMGDLKNKLDESEDKLERFAVNNDLSVVKGVTGFSASRLESLETQLLEEENRRAEINSIFTVVQEAGTQDLSLLRTLDEINTNSTIQDLRREEIASQRRVSELAEVYGPKHPKMIGAKADYQAIQGKLAEEISNIAGNAEKMLQASDRRIEEIKTSLQAALSEHQSFRILDNEFRRLQREVDTNRNLYDTFMERTKETSIAADFDSAHARFTDYAMVPIVPSKPNKKLIVILTFVASLGGGVVLAFVINALNDSFRNSSDVEQYLGTRLLGTLPRLPLKKNQDVPLHAFYDNEYLGFSEAFRSIRTGLTLTHIDKTSKVIEITSSVPNEGKTTTAINLAYSFAQMEKVILIDADMRRPSIGGLFGLPNYHPGLANIISGADKFEDCVIKDEVSGISVMPAGNIPPNPLELLSSKKFERLMTVLRTKYDRVIIDMAPTRTVSDALVVAKEADVVLYAIRADSTKHKVAKHGIGRLLEVHAKIGGVILTQVDIDKNESHYDFYDYQDFYGTSNEKTSSSISPFS